MKYLKRFETESEYDSYKNGDSYILPNISFINNISGIKSEAYKPPIRRIATFEVTDNTDKVLFSNCEAIKSIKVNGVIDNNFIPFKGLKEVNLNNVDIFNSVNLDGDLFIQNDDTGLYDFNTAAISAGNLNDLINKFSKLSFIDTMVFDNEINIDNLVFLVVSDNFIEENYLNQMSFYVLSDNNTLTINEVIKDEIEMFKSSFMLFFIYDKTNPYNRYSFTTEIYDGTEVYSVYENGTYEVEIELTKYDLPLNMFSNHNLNDEELPGYMVPNPLISINNDFLKDCTIPSFAFTNLKTILIPSSSKLPIPISSKYYKTDFRQMGMYWFNFVHGLFMNCFNLTNIEFEKGTVVSKERLYGFVKNCYSLKNIDFKNVIWDYNDTEIYEKVENIHDFYLNTINLNDILFKDAYYNDPIIEYINLNGMINSGCTSFSYSEDRYYHTLKEIDFGKCDFSNITDMNYMFNNCRSLKTIRMSGPLNDSVTVRFMFDGVAENGEFYYDSNYDYSRIISVLPSTWVAIPF